MSTTNLTISNGSSDIDISSELTNPLCVDDVFVDVGTASLPMVSSLIWVNYLYSPVVINESHPGYVITNANAISTQDAPIQYSIQEGNELGIFIVDGVTGEIKLDASLE